MDLRRIERSQSVEQQRPATGPQATPDAADSIVRPVTRDAKALSGEKAGRATLPSDHRRDRALQLALSMVEPAPEGKRSQLDRLVTPDADVATQTERGLRLIEDLQDPRALPTVLGIIERGGETAARASAVFKGLLPFAGATDLEAVQSRLSKASGNALANAADNALAKAKNQVDQTLNERTRGVGPKAPERSGAEIHWREAGRGLVDFGYDMTVGTAKQVMDDPLRFVPRMAAGVVTSFHSAVKNSGGAIMGLATAGAYGSYGAQMTQELANSATWASGFSKGRRTKMHADKFADVHKVTKDGFARAMQCWDDVHKKPILTERLAKSLHVKGETLKPIAKLESHLRDTKNKLWYGTEIIYEADAPQKKGTVRKGAVWKDQGWEPTKVKEGHTLGTENQALYDALDNKWAEYDVVSKAMPEAMAPTVLAKNFIEEMGLKVPRNKADRAVFLESLEAKLHERFPKGFFVKGVQDFNTGGNLPTNKSNFRALYEGYHREFVPFEKKVGPNQDLLRSHPFQGGRMLNDMLKNPESVVIQERMDLKKWTKKELPIHKQPFQEFRVHVVRGQVVPGASSHRWSLAKTMLDRKNMKGAEAFTQQLFDKLPDNIKKNMAFSPDIVQMADGSFKVIELNVGGNSGFLHRNPLAANKMVEAVTGRETNGLYLARRLGYSAVASTLVATHQQHARVQDAPELPKPAKK
jgi:hypothetical protein